MSEVYAINIECKYNMDMPGDQEESNSYILFKNQDKAIKYLHSKVQTDFLEEMSDLCGRDCSIMDLNIQNKSIESEAPEIESEAKLYAYITKEPVH